jgi:D-glycero-alpha-D-manno-heptose 1-phosphate guanylyltransferase
MIDCIILAGGLGTRLRPVVSDRPKPLARINGVPFLDLLLAQVTPVVEKVIFAVGHLGEQIVTKYPEHLFSFENKPLGTGGAIQKALSQVSSEYVLVMNGDSYIEFDLPSFLTAHREKNADATILFRSIPDASRYGLLKMDGEKIIGFEEKKSSAKEGLINAGVYLFRKDLLEELMLGESFSLERDVFPLLLKKRLFGYPSNGLFIDIGTPESYLEAQNVLKPFTPANS